MIKSQLVKKLLNKNPHLIQKDVEGITSLVLEKITSTLENDGRVEIRGFGSLSVRKRKFYMFPIIILLISLIGVTALAQSGLVTFIYPI